MRGLEAIKDIFNHIYNKATTYEEDVKLNNDRETIEKELKAFEFLTKNFRVMVGVDEGKDLDCACLMLHVEGIDKFFMLASAYKQQDLETYKQLLELKEVLKND